MNPTPNVVEERIPTALDGERLDRVVALMLDISRSQAATILAAGGVEVDGQPAPSGKIRLQTGMTVRVDASVVAAESGPIADPAISFGVVHADDDLVVIDKPAGLVVHPGAGNPDGTLVNGLLARFPQVANVGEPSRPGIVHRLDAGTSGLMLVALSEAAYETLVAELAEHRIHREYLALVWGEPEARTGVIDAPVGRSPRDPLRMAVVPDGKPARTHYEVLEVLPGPGSGARSGESRAGQRVSLLRCRLETGRTHQIRVHLSAIGHPVVGDATYGGARSALSCDRPMLHSARLVLDHPVTGNRMEFELAPPADFASVTDLCRA